MKITAHAVERYHQRIRPGLTLDEAETMLVNNTANAIRIKGNTRYGQLRYHAGDCTLIVKETADMGLVVVSIYPLFGHEKHTHLKWSNAVNAEVDRLHALIDSVCKAAEPRGDVEATAPVVSAASIPKGHTAPVRAARFNQQNAADILERAEREFDRIKQLEKQYRINVEAAQKRASKAQEHATRKQQESDAIRELAIDLIRALPEQMAREIASRHGEAGYWTIARAFKNSS